ncbi:unnamed protein product, partial [Phaeothamnion confervicola]
MDLTKEALKKACRENDLYSTPSLNDRLYLHYKGIRRIENLEEYTALRVLWLEGNGLAKIEGLDHQAQLRTLYLHENLIEKIENIDALVDLDTLNLTRNYIKKIEGLDNLPKLTTLLLGHNILKTAEDVRHILQCPSLQTLDLQHNHIEDPAVMDVVAAVPGLRVLYLMGNPIIKVIKHYRKTIVSRCSGLKYLDDRPVFDDERMRCTAWARGFAAGGVDAANTAERAEIVRLRDEKRGEDERQHHAFE